LGGADWHCWWQAQLDELVSDRWKRRARDPNPTPATAAAASVAASVAASSPAAPSAADSARCRGAAGADDGAGVHVLVDGLGVLVGAQYSAAVGGGAGTWRRDVSLRANVAALSALVEGGRRVRQRLVWGPAAASGGGAWRRWRQCGYDARRCGAGPMASGAEAEGGTSLQGKMAAEVDAQLRLSEAGAGPRRTLVLLVCQRGGDGEAALAAAAGRALEHGWDVEVWAWEVGVCDWFLDAGLAAKGPGRFTLVSFEGARSDITFTAAAAAAATGDGAMAALGGGGGSGSCGGGSGGVCVDDDDGAEEDEDDDWAMCPITCEPMTDPVLVRGGGPRHFERSALEAWIERAGSCPLTRCPLCSSDVLPPAPAFAARLAARRAREGLSK
jgi:hypothetical protein